MSTDCAEAGFDLAGVIHDLGEDGGCAPDCSGCEVEPSPVAAAQRTDAEPDRPDWLPAPETQCECTLSLKTHQHRAHVGRRCPVREGVHGGRLHHTVTGAFYCKSCWNKARQAEVEAAAAAVAGAPVPAVPVEDPNTLTLF
jgi:hypothetical protein